MAEWVNAPLSQADLDRVRRIGMFAPLTPEGLAALLAEAQSVTLPAFQEVFGQDQVARHFFVVIEGMVGTLAALGADLSCLVELVGPGDMVGEAGLFDTGRYPVAARALTEARLVAIPVEAVRASLDRDVALRRRMLGFLSVRLRVLVRQIAQLKLMSAAQRLGMFLAGLAGPGAGPHLVRLACERRVIAGILGMTPECLSRSLRQLRAEGVESRGRWKIVVQDSVRLKAFAMGGRT